MGVWPARINADSLNYSSHFEAKLIRNEVDILRISHERRANDQLQLI